MEADSAAPQVPEPESSVTNHEIRIGGEAVRYTATAGYLIVDDADEKPAAKFGYTAYVREGTSDAAARPVTFAFNGGPGSASIWLHMGVLGPKIVVTPDADFAPPPPYDVRRQRVQHPRRHGSRDDRPRRHGLQPAGGRGRGRRTSGASTRTSTRCPVSSRSG